MSSSLQMEVRGAEQWAFALNRLQQETRRNAIDSLTYAGVKIAISGRKIAKPGAKKRDVVRNTDFRRMVRDRRKWAKMRGTNTRDFVAKNVFPFFIITYRQRGEPTKVGTWKPQSDPRRQIENRGLAQKMWNILYGQLASLKGTADTSLQNGAAEIKRNVTGSVTRYTVRLNLAVRLNYLEKAYPGIGQSAIANGQASLVNELNRRQELAIQRANRKAA